MGEIGNLTGQGERPVRQKRYNKSWSQRRHPRKMGRERKYQRQRKMRKGKDRTLTDVQEEKESRDVLELVPGKS